jgi:hypothetical protein
MSNKKLLIDVLKNLNDPKNKVKKAAGIDTTPQMKKGGSKFSSDLNATNRLFKKNSLFKKNPLNKPNALFKKKNLKRKTYSPTAPGSSSPMFFNNGGIVQIDGYRFKKDANGRWTYESGAPVTDTMLIQKLNNGEGKPVGSPVVQNAPKYEAKVPMSNVERRQKISDLRMSPQISDQQEADKLFEIQREQDIYYPDVSDQLMVPPKNMSDLKAAEWRVNNSLGFPMERARLAAEAAAGPDDDPVDNFRHANAGRYTAEAINSYINIPLTLLGQKYLSPAISFVGSNLSGIGHELSTLFGGIDDRDWTDKLRESGEDIYNNYVGAKVGASDMTPIEKTNYLLYLSDNNKLPDGIVGGKNKKGQTNNMYFKKGPNDPGEYKSSYNDGGYIETELTPEEIEEYRKGGYIVEDISVPSLNQMEEGGGPCPPGYYRVNGRCVKMNDLIHRKAKPYITHDPKDPRIKAFNDSLNLYNQSIANHKELKRKNLIPVLTNLPPSPEYKRIYDKHLKKQKIQPVGYIHGQTTSKTKKHVKGLEYPVYAQPVQEVIYKPKPKAKKKITKLVEEKPVVVQPVIRKENPPIYTSDINDPRLKSYTDSLNLYTQYKAKEDDFLKHGSIKGEIKKGSPDKYNEVLKKVGPGKYKTVKEKNPDYHPTIISKEFQTYVIPKITESNVNVDGVKFNTIEAVAGQSPILEKPLQPVIYRPVVQPTVQEEAMGTMPILKPTHIDHPLNKFIGEPIPTTVQEEIPEEIIEDTEDTVYIEDAGEPESSGHWEQGNHMYIDWKGNQGKVKTPKFRKHGHSGPLIKGSNTHYFRYPSIERRHDIWIEPDEEYAVGGEYNLGDEVELTEAEVKRLRSLGYIIEQI